VKPKAPPRKPVTTYEFGGRSQQLKKVRRKTGYASYQTVSVPVGSGKNSGWSLPVYTYHKKVDGKIVATKTSRAKYTDPNNIKSLFS